MKLLVFDIGSNSIRTAKLEETARGAPRISDKRVFTTRLAEGLSESGVLSDARMRQSLLVIRSLCAEALPLGFSVYAYATNAVRDAKNGPAFAEEVESIVGAGHVQVLSGDEEAQFVQTGADPTGTRTILDIGGGSTQIARGAYRESWPIGCVRAKDLAPYDDIYRIAESLRPVLTGLFGPPDGTARPAGSARSANGPNEPIGVGGTITTLALLTEGRSSFSVWQGEKEVQYISLLAALRDLNILGDARRASIPLLKDRHDVILHGGVILLYLMEYLHATVIGASLRDGLDGYAMHLFHTLSSRV